MLMNAFGEAWISRNATYFSDPAASPDALLNDATEWLQYAYHNLQVLTELVHERGMLDARRLTVVLEGVAAFMEMGMRCAVQGHLRMQLELVKEGVVGVVGGR
jgi:hypothetical protein